MAKLWGRVTADPTISTCYVILNKKNSTNDKKNSTNDNSNSDTNDTEMVNDDNDKDKDDFNQCRRL